MCFYTLLITVDDKDKATGAKVWLRLFDSS